MPEIREDVPQFLYRGHGLLAGAHGGGKAVDVLPQHPVHGVVPLAEVFQPCLLCSWIVGDRREVGGDGEREEVSHHASPSFGPLRPLYAPDVPCPAPPASWTPPRSAWDQSGVP